MKGTTTRMAILNLLLLSISLLLPSRLWCQEDWLEKGISSLNTQHIEEAIKAFTKAIAMNPNHMEAYNNRGIAWCKKGDYVRAIADYKKALEIDPRSAEVYNNRGGLWFYRGQYDLAINDYDKALGIDTNFAKAYTNRGAAWFCKGNIESAVADYKRALEINPNSAEAHKQLAWILSANSGHAGKEEAQSSTLTQKDIKLHPKAETFLPPPAHVDGLPIEPVPHELTGRMPHTASKTAFTIQVGAFQSRENAETLFARLKNKGHAAYLLPFESWSKKTLYTVRIGEYATRREAEDEAASFSCREKLPSTVRPADEL